MALTADGEGPNGFSFESSLIMIDVGAGVPPVRPPGLRLLDRGFQASNFLKRQMAKFSRRNIKLQRSVAHPLYFLHVMADRFEHSPDLPVLAFDQRDFIPGIVRLTNRLRSWRALSWIAAPLLIG